MNIDVTVTSETFDITLSPDPVVAVITLDGPPGPQGPAGPMGPPNLLALVFTL